MAATICFASCARVLVADVKEIEMEHNGRMLKDDDEIVQGSSIVENHHEITIPGFNSYVPVPGGGR
ncbi:hypothetical protein Ancab_012876 [Ancistrocladus abbreviatus]